MRYGLSNQYWRWKHKTRSSPAHHNKKSQGVRFGIMMAKATVLWPATNPLMWLYVIKKYREDSSTFEIPYFVAKMVVKFVAKVGEPDVAAASHPILIPVKLSSQP
ncbi:hypothetical protein AVEN_46193-1 [Araneus ventricosus]|uniref:Uncharacterized protein n=1 Tax=Araneus ventricosus TaxID=182803 RepID=A0A4Y2EA22_ARAVE|nr:hypothetical protein AVEN_46193-1 [Araneus ventricosus]